MSVLWILDLIVFLLILYVTLLIYDVERPDSYTISCWSSKMLNAFAYRQVLRFYESPGCSIDWLIDCLVFYAICAIFQSCNGECLIDVLPNFPCSQTIAVEWFFLNLSEVYDNKISICWSILSRYVDRCNLDKLIDKILICWSFIYEFTIFCISDFFFISIIFIDHNQRRRTHTLFFLWRTFCHSKKKYFLKKSKTFSHI